MNLSDNQGFTLVEMLVAVAVTTIVLLASYSVFGSITKVENRLRSESEIFHQTRVFFDRFGREIRGAYFNKNNERTSFTGASTELSFSTTVSTPSSEGFGGMSVVSYRLKTTDSDAGSVLLRMESPLGIEVGEQREYEMIDGLSSFSLRYYRNGNWTDSWTGTTSGSLPSIIEVTLNYGEEDAYTKQSFVSAVELPMADL